jgi:hypothetical protein
MDEKVILFFGFYLLKQPIPKELFEQVRNTDVDTELCVLIAMISNAPDQTDEALRGLILKALL